MMNDTRPHPPTVRVGRLTIDGQDTVWRSLWTYCTSILADGDPPDYRGSGTFVNANGVSCLLTAAHVWERLAQDSSIGFAMEDEQAPVWLRIEALSARVVTTRPSDEWGPDIAVVALHAHDVARLKKEKAFYVVERARPIPDDPRIAMVWALTGASAAFSLVTAAEARLKNHTLIVSNPEHITHEDLDYIEVPYGDTPPEQIPDSWRGLSGAGLWHCALVPGSDETELDVVPELSGLAFCEQIVENRRGTIRCHGSVSLRSLGLEQVA